MRDYRPLGPAYIIIAGAQRGEGAVISKAFNATAEAAHEPMKNVDVWPLQEALEAGSFYILQTNYDRGRRGRVSPSGTAVRVGGKSVCVCA